jgi:hypothetical protein
VVVDQVRRLAHEHPHAYPVLLTGRVSPVPGLRLFAAQLRVLQAAGFDESQAAAILRAAFGYALGYAAMELSTCRSRAAPSMATRTRSSKQCSRSAAPFRPTSRPNWPGPRALSVSQTSQQFEFGLEALLAGLET